MFLHETKEEMLGNFVILKKICKTKNSFTISGSFFPQTDPGSDPGSTSIGNGSLALIFLESG